MSASSQSTIALIDLAAIQNQTPAGTQIDQAMRTFNGLTLLEWTVRRLSESTLVDQVVITGLPSYLPQIQDASLCGARWMPSLQNDSLARANEIAERTNAGWLVLVSPTCPFIDPALLDRLVVSAWNRPEADYVGYMAAHNPRMNLGKLGLVGEICAGRALKKAVDRKLDALPELVNVFRSHPNLFLMHWIPLPNALDREGLRFALETASDMEQATSYVEAGGVDISWQRLVELSDSE